MKIQDRGQLIKVIKDGLETNIVRTEENKTTSNTIAYDEKERKFYRVSWGEVKDGENNFYLWYDENPVIVTIDNESGLWLTNAEKKEQMNNRSKSSIGEEITDIEWSNIDKGLIFINGLKSDDDYKNGVNKVQVVGGRTGQGKTTHVLRETAKALEEKQSVLYFSFEESQLDVIKGIVRQLAPEALAKIEGKGYGDATPYEVKSYREATDLISNSKLIIDNNPSMDDNYMVKRMEEVAKSNNGLDLVVIDFLRLSQNQSNVNEIINVHDRMEIYRRKLGCKVIITTQLAKVNR